MSTKDEQACVLAALILADDGIAVTEEKIKAILKAAGVDVEPFWPGMFAKCLDGVDIKDMVSNVGSGSGGAAAAPAAGGAAEPAAEEKVEEKKEESEESDDDMGFGLFD
eukprot:TRINITY_DN64493_c0_g1_i1.p1 TRINITY_DN64493_c0_g1~~TRINITY_DN64493_c0_g1_i1.p1  ORF type:complete len:109 (+),score=36.60 TRINITY_DN64493_c0_g1_i1:77-403(+)